MKLLSALRMPTFNPADVGLMNSVFSCYFRLFSLVTPNGFNLFVRQPSVPMVKSIVMPALNTCVFVIVCLCSKLEMIWINARRVVALVHNDHSFWNRAIDKLKHVAMRSYGFFSGKQENSVSVSVFCPRPLPTTGFKFFVFIMENIIRPNYRKLMQSFSIPHAVVMVAAKFSSYCFGITKNALDKTLRLISHFILPVKSNGPIIFLSHGGV